MKRKVHQIDSRVLKTEQAIKEAFMELVKEKGYNQVTVSDICKKSSINRNTFYLHYLDKDDLVGKMLKTAYSTMDNALKDYTIKYKTSMRRISEVQIRWGIRNLLSFMESDKELYKTILQDESLNGYIDVIAKMLKKHIAELLDISNASGNMIYEYAFSGMFGLIKQWVLYSPTNIYVTSKIVAKLAYTNLQQFNEFS
jgi:AcrR family transcriptional regulator